MQILSTRHQRYRTFGEANSSPMRPWAILLRRLTSNLSTSRPCRSNTRSSPRSFLRPNPFTQLLIQRRDKEWHVSLLAIALHHFPYGVRPPSQVARHINRPWAVTLPSRRVLGGGRASSVIRRPPRTPPLQVFLD